MKTPHYKSSAGRMTLAAVLMASGLLAQQNGLNNTAGAPNIELGGDLIRPTNVTLENSGIKYDLIFNGEGQFGVGNNLTAGSSLPTSKAIFSYNNSNPNFTPLYGTIFAKYFSPPGTTLPTDVRGIVNQVNADCPYIWGYESLVTGNAGGMVGVKAEVIRSSTGVSTYATGVVGYADGAYSNCGGEFKAHTPAGQGGQSKACGISATARGDLDNYGGIFIADSGAVNRAVYAETRNNPNNVVSANIAVNGYAEGAGYVTNSYMNIGVLGVADYANTSYGVAGFLSASRTLPTPAINAAVYGDAQFASGLNQPWAGYFEGDVNITGIGVIPGGVWTGSDQRLKKDINPITNSKSIIAKLQPKSFTYNAENEIGLKLQSRKDYGIIAQELEKVMPELVRNEVKPAIKDKNGNVITAEKPYKVVNYNAFIGILLANAQEQQKEIDEQKQLNEQLEQRIAELEKKAGTATGLNTSNEGIQGFSMSQNEPNPFTHETLINYNLPKTVSSAYMAVYDLSGKQVNKFDLDKNGASISITAEKLSAGIYIYSIVADGKVMDSKKMIVADK